MSVELILGGVVVLANTLRHWDREPETRSGTTDYWSKALMTLVVVVVAEVVWAYVWSANH